jgi:hypothetical protein
MARTQVKFYEIERSVVVLRRSHEQLRMNKLFYINAVEKGGTRSIEEIPRLLGISSRAGAKSRDTRGEDQTLERGLFV